VQIGKLDMASERIEFVLETDAGSRQAVLADGDLAYAVYGVLGQESAVKVQLADQGDSGEGQVLAKAISYVAEGRLVDLLDPDATREN
jgi:hypothetical protein